MGRQGAESAKTDAKKNCFKREEVRIRRWRSAADLIPGSSRGVPLGVLGGLAAVCAPRSIGQGVEGAVAPAGAPMPRRSSACTGPSHSPIAAAASATRASIAACTSADSRDGRDIDRLGEERPIERIGLIEQRERLQATAAQQPFECDLGSGDEVLDEDRAGGFGIARDKLGVGEQACEARKAVAQLGGVVRAHDAAAGRQMARLDHDGKPQLAGQRDRIGIERHHAKARLHHAGRGQPLSQAQLVGSRAGGLDGIERQPQTLGREGADQRGLLVGHDDPGERRRGLRDLHRGVYRIPKVECECALRPGLGEHVAAIASDHELDAHRLGRPAKVGRLVGGRCCEQQQAVGCHPLDIPAGPTGASGSWSQIPEGVDVVCNEPR